jgi:HK97 family phage prohead protease
MDLEQQFSVDRPEVRSVAFTDVDTSNDGWSFEGLAAVYNEETDLGPFTESVSRGAYRKALADGTNVPMLYHHNDQLPVLATIGGGTLQLIDDAKGLRVKADIAKHYVGEAVRELVKRGDIKGMSAGFIVGKGNSRFEQRASGRVHRTINNFRKILDVSPTWEPAYAGTSAELRSLRAIQMAESLEAAQQMLSGAYPQLEHRALPPEAVTGDEPAKTECDACGNSPCECAPVDEQRSGADAQAAAAARTRALHLLGLQLPS